MWHWYDDVDEGQENLFKFSDVCSGTRSETDSQKDPLDKKTNLLYLDLKFSKLEKTEMITCT